MVVIRATFFLMLVFVISGISSAGTGYQGVLLSPEKSINKYDLIDHNGKIVKFPQTKGKYQLV